MQRLLECDTGGWGWKGSFRARVSGTGKRSEECEEIERRGYGVNLHVHICDVACIVAMLIFFKKSGLLHSKYCDPDYFHSIQRSFQTLEMRLLL